MSQPDKQTAAPRIQLPACYVIHPGAKVAMMGTTVLLLFIIASPGVDLPPAVRSAALAAAMFNFGMMASRVAQIWQKQPVPDEVDDE